MVDEAIMGQVDQIIEPQPQQKEPPPKQPWQHRLRNIFWRRDQTDSNTQPVVKDTQAEVHETAEAEKPKDLIDKSSPKSFILSVLLTPSRDVNEALKHASTADERTELKYVQKLRFHHCQKDTGRYDSQDDSDRRISGSIGDRQYQDVVTLHKYPTSREREIITQVISASGKERRAMSWDRLFYVYHLFSERSLRASKRPDDNDTQLKSGIQAVVQMSSLVPDEREKLLVGVNQEMLALRRIVNSQRTRLKELGYKKCNNDVLRAKERILDDQEVYANQIIPLLRTERKQLLSIEPEVVERETKGVAPTAVEQAIDKSNARMYVASVLTTPHSSFEDLHNNRYKLSKQESKEVEFVYQLRSKLSQHDDGVIEKGDVDRKKVGEVNRTQYDDIILLHKYPTDRETSIINRVLNATPEELETVDLDELIYVRGLVDAKMFTPELGVHGAGRKTLQGFKSVFKSMESPEGDRLFREVRVLSMNLGRVIYAKRQEGKVEVDDDPLNAKNRILKKAYSE